jgi:hypothetical protein
MNDEIIKSKIISMIAMDNKHLAGTWGHIVYIMGC